MSPILILNFITFTATHVKVLTEVMLQPATKVGHTFMLICFVSWVIYDECAYKVGVELTRHRLKLFYHLNHVRSKKIGGIKTI